MNILEYIDNILPQDQIDIHFLALPEGAEGLLIEEYGVNGRITNFNGFEGVTSSRIQFYARLKPNTNTYKTITSLLKSFYKLVQEQKGQTQENIKLLWVGEFSLTPAMRDEKNNYIFSLDFPVIYKEV